MLVQNACHFASLIFKLLKWKLKMILERHVSARIFHKSNFPAFFSSLFCTEKSAGNFDTSIQNIRAETSLCLLSCGYGKFNASKTFKNIKSFFFRQGKGFHLQIRSSKIPKLFRAYIMTEYLTHWHSWKTKYFRKNLLKTWSLFNNASFGAFFIQIDQNFEPN